MKKFRQIILAFMLVIIGIVIGIVFVERDNIGGLFNKLGYDVSDSVSEMFDKFSYDEVFKSVSRNVRESCAECKHNVFGSDGTCGKFIPPSELNNEKGLIGVCEWTKFAQFSLNVFNFGYKNDEIKIECTTKPSEWETGLRKIDESSGALLIENKYKVVKIVESAEYDVGEYGQGFCKKYEVYKLKRRQSKN